MGVEKGSYKGHNFEDGSAAIIAACREVATELGSGFAEVTYQRALAFELTIRGIAFVREAELAIYYKGEAIDIRRADFLVGDIIVELKALKELLPEHVAQLAMYLKAAHYRLGLLINFGERYVRTKRVINSSIDESQSSEKST